MQIHELPAGSPASGLQFAGDTGSQTQKIDYDALANAILSKLTTKTFDIKSESQTIIAALNALGDASKQGVANNLVTTAAGLVLDARQGKALDDKIASLNSSTTLTLTRTEQNWVDATDFARMSASRRGNTLYLKGNLCVRYAGGFSGSFQQIGQISDWNAMDIAYVNVPAQNDGSKVVAIQITKNGLINIYSNTEFSGDPPFRFSLAVPCA